MYADGSGNFEGEIAERGKKQGRGGEGSRRERKVGAGRKERSRNGNVSVNMH